MARRESDHRIVPMKRGNARRGKAVTQCHPHQRNICPTQRGRTRRMITELARITEIAKAKPKESMVELAALYLQVNQDLAGASNGRGITALFAIIYIIFGRFWRRKFITCRIAYQNTANRSKPCGDAYFPAHFTIAV